MNFHISIEKAKEKLANEIKDRFTIMMKDGDMSVEYYQPVQEDLQSPHKQDELYIITSGSGNFRRAEDIVPCKTGDILFVPAGMVHRFEDFTEDFATWVIFYGPTK